MGFVKVPGGGSAKSVGAFVDGGRFEIEIAAERFPAIASARPFCDPSGSRLRL